MNTFIDGISRQSSSERECFLILKYLASYAKIISSSLESMQETITSRLSHLRVSERQGRSDHPRLSVHAPLNAVTTYRPHEHVTHPNEEVASDGGPRHSITYWHLVFRPCTT